MLARINILYNAIFDVVLLNELCVVLFPQYFVMKFEINKGIASVRGNQIETRRGCIIVTKTVIK